MALLKRVLAPVVDVRDEETALTAMMFGYSFLAMTAYNMVQPITRSKFITAHGAENLPYVVLASIVLIALLMQGYSKLGRLMPWRWIIPVTQSLMVGFLVLFWALYADPAAMRAPSGGAIETSAVQGWVATVLYWFGQIYAILLISQFWTLANLIFDPRQAKRLFGFIGAGASLGGFVGGSLPAFFAQALGSRQLPPVSAIVLALCTLVVVAIVSRVRGVDLRGLETAGEERGVGGQEALRMLRESKHLQIIAVVIGLTSIGAGLVDQQLNMATEAFAGRDRTDAMTAVLGQVQVYVSAIGFVIQMFLTTRIQRLLGVGFALMLLPIGFGVMAVIILLNAALWAPMLARVMDKSLRYTVDKTSREILFLPLPDAIKNKAKPFVDVMADRFARALQGFVVLILIAPWGLGFTWQQISYASLVVLAVWIAMVVVAKRAYTHAFRSSLAQRVVRTADLRLSVADLTTIETLVEELAHPDPARVLYAIDLLETFDKRNLVTPLLLSHESPAVRVRALQALASVRGDIAVRRVPQIRRLLGDPDHAVRAAAIGALASISKESAATLSRPLLSDADPRIRVTAAAALASGDRAEDLDAADEALAALVFDTDESARDARRGRGDTADRQSEGSRTPDPSHARRGSGGRRGSDRERPRERDQRLQVRAGARRPAAQPQAEGARPIRARRIRWARGGRARPLPARAGRGPLGPPAHSSHARAHPLAEDGRRPRRSAGGAGRISSLQGRGCAGTSSPRAPGPGVPPGAHRSPDDQGVPPLLRTPDAVRASMADRLPNSCGPARLRSGPTRNRGHRTARSSCSPPRVRTLTTTSGRFRCRIAMPGRGCRPGPLSGLVASRPTAGGWLTPPASPAATRFTSGPSRGRVSNGSCPNVGA